MMRGSDTFPVNDSRPRFQSGQNSIRRERLCWLIFIWLLLQFLQFTYCVASWAFVRDKLNITISCPEPNRGPNSVVSQNGDYNELYENNIESGSSSSTNTLFMHNLNSHRVLAFGLFWLQLFSLIFSYIGYLIIKPALCSSSYASRNRQQFRRPLKITGMALGVFTGVACTMALWSVTLAVEAGDILLAKKYRRAVHLTRAYVEIRALTAMMMCLLYTIFTVLLVSWQEDIITENDVQGREIEKKRYFDEDTEEFDDIEQQNPQNSGVNSQQTPSLQVISTPVRSRSTSSRRNMNLRVRFQENEVNISNSGSIDEINSNNFHVQDAIDRGIAESSALHSVPSASDAVGVIERRRSDDVDVENTRQSISLSTCEELEQT